MTARLAAVGVAVFLAGTATLAAQEAERVAAHSDWSFFVQDEPTQCWVVSPPKETVNTRDGRVVAVRRGDIYLFVSFWPDSERMGEVSFMGGYPFAQGSTVTVTVGERSFELFTQGETAWSLSPEDDNAMAEAMKRGAEAVVVGQSSRGTTTTDTFSLIGFTAAFDDAERRCDS